MSKTPPERLTDPSTDTGWVDWPGVAAIPKGVRPAFDKGIQVYVRYQDGFEKQAKPPVWLERYMWQHTRDDFNIVAYKIGGTI